MINKAKCTALLAALSSPALAGPPALEIPIDCTLGKTCYIEDYVDNDPSPGQADYTCGLKSRQDHNGTDFVLLSFEAMKRGVDVLASAGGIVSATRDGMPDVPVTDQDHHRIKGRECGNALRIDHGDGWQTLYCHMAQGSIRVKNGDIIEAGQAIGQIGLSGMSNVPHVHLTVLKDGLPVDPFAPEANKTCGAQVDKSLWREPPIYHAAGLFTAGFAAKVPSFDDVRTGAARRKSGSHDEPIVFYTRAFHAAPGDTLTLVATGPAGEIFANTFELKTPQKDLFQAFGQHSPKGGWPVGRYRGYATLRRNGRILAVRHADFSVDP